MLLYPIGTGAGVPVWVIDTGINYEHNDVAGRAELFFDYQNGDVSTQTSFPKKIF